MDALLDGTLAFVTTDHSPCTPELKLKFDSEGPADFHRAWGGISSLQLGLANIWSEARARGAGLDDLYRWLSLNPAQFAGLSARKGAIRRGCDADLVVWQPDEEFIVRREDLQYRHKISPYIGRRLHGVVQETYLRGERIFASGDLQTRPFGRTLLHREQKENLDE